MSASAVAATAAGAYIDAVGSLRIRSKIQRRRRAPWSDLLNLTLTNSQHKRSRREFRYSAHSHPTNCIARCPTQPSFFFFCWCIVVMLVELTRDSLAYTCEETHECIFNPMRGGEIWLITCDRAPCESDTSRQLRASYVDDDLISLS